MKLKFIQNIIDFFRAKEHKIQYNELSETIRFLSLSQDIDETIKDLIIKKHKYPQFTLNRDKKLLKEYLKNFNPGSIPPATGKYREHQLKLLDFSKTVIPVLEENGITPLLIGGTLLGAVRNNGFIPWDDDVDFEVLREDFEKLHKFVQKNYIYLDTSEVKDYQELLHILDKEVQKNPNQIIFAQLPSSICAYRGTSLEDLQILDFFPRDYLNDNVSEKEYLKYRKSFNKALAKFSGYKDFFNLFEQELKNKKIYVNDSSLTVKSWGSYGFTHYEKTVPIKKEDIFPFKKILFEDYEFHTIQNPENYFKTMYGDWEHLPIFFDIGLHIKRIQDVLDTEERKYYIQIEDIM